MRELQRILNSYFDSHNRLVQEIEIYIAKQYIFNIIENGEDCVRIFPKDGSHFIELSSNHGIEGKLYLVFLKLYEIGLHHYIDAMHFYGGCVSFHIKRIYSQKDVKEAFNNHFKNEITVSEVSGDFLIYDFDKKYFNDV
jgi:hypothetical protein